MGCERRLTVEEWPEDGMAPCSTVEAKAEQLDARIAAAVASRQWRLVRDLTWLLGDIDNLAARFGADTDLGEALVASHPAPRPQPKARATKARGRR
jgi:hypothetical protein